MSSNSIANIISTTLAPLWRPLKQKFEAHPIASALIIGSVVTIAAVHARPLWNRVYVEKQKEGLPNPTTELKPSNPAPDQKPDILTQLKEAQRQAALHRTHEKFYPPDVPLPIVDNSDFTHCDPYYSKVFHNLAAQFFSGGNLKQYEPMMREKASQLLRDEPNVNRAIKEYAFQMFSEILFGYKGRSDTGPTMPELMGAWLLPCSDPKKFLASIQDDHRLSNKQVHNFIAVMWRETSSTTDAALRNQIVRACRHPDLQDRALNAVNQKDLDDQILRFIIEEHRMDPSISGFIERGPTIIRRPADFVNEKEIVGADPQIFNPSRYQRLPSSWYGFPWMPFGNGGPNRCPGMEFHKYLSKQFLTELFLNYRLEGINAFGEVVTDAHDIDTRTRISSVIVRTRKSPILTKILHTN